MVYLDPESVRSAYQGQEHGGAPVTVVMVGSNALTDSLSLEGKVEDVVAELNRLRARPLNMATNALSFRGLPAIPGTAPTGQEDFLA